MEFRFSCLECGMCLLVCWLVCFDLICGKLEMGKEDEEGNKVEWRWGESRRIGGKNVWLCMEDLVMCSHYKVSKVPSQPQDNGRKPLLSKTT